jgi:enoyl-CoA hydratase/carnithine racemase
MSIRATKQAVRRSEATDVLTALREEWAWPAVVAMLASHDAQEGPVAFTQKRKPVWRGK